MAISDYLKDTRKLETVQAKAVVEGDGFFSRSLYLVADEPGIWRRVARSGSGLKKKGEGHVLAFNDDSGQIMELARYTKAEEELWESAPKPF